MKKDLVKVYATGTIGEEGKPGFHKAGTIIECTQEVADYFIKHKIATEGEVEEVKTKKGKK